MPLTQITVHIRGDVVFIDPESRLCLCGDEDCLSPILSNLLEQGFLKFLLNLHRVDYIDSTGLGAIVRAYTVVKRKGATLRMFNVAGRIRGLLDVNKLSPLFEVCDSEEDALRSFERPRSSGA